MKPEEPYQEIGDLLRSRTPEPVSSPGLEMRILRALDERRCPKSGIAWRWLILPPALAGLALLLWHPGKEPEKAVSARPFPTEAPAMPHAVAAAIAADPLHSESLALANDARRAGDFLVNCLPSLPGAP